MSSYHLSLDHHGFGPLVSGELRVKLKLLCGVVLFNYWFQLCLLFLVSLVCVDSCFFFKMLFGGSAKTDVLVTGATSPVEGNAM